jgi:hypothetical protein
VHEEGPRPHRRRHREQIAVAQACAQRPHQPPAEQRQGHHAGQPEAGQGLEVEVVGVQARVGEAPPGDRGGDHLGVAAPEVVGAHAEDRVAAPEPHRGLPQLAPAGQRGGDPGLEARAHHARRAPAPARGAARQDVDGLIAGERAALAEPGDLLAHEIPAQPVAPRRERRHHEPLEAHGPPGRHVGGQRRAAALELQARLAGGRRRLPVVAEVHGLRAPVRPGERAGVGDGDRQGRLGAGGQRERPGRHGVARPVPGAVVPEAQPLPERRLGARRQQRQPHQQADRGQRPARRHPQGAARPPARHQHRRAGEGRAHEGRPRRAREDRRHQHRGRRGGQCARAPRAHPGQRRGQRQSCLPVHGADRRVGEGAAGPRQPQRLEARGVERLPQRRRRRHQHLDQRGARRQQRTGDHSQRDPAGRDPRSHEVPGGEEQQSARHRTQRGLERVAAVGGRQQGAQPHDRQPDDHRAPQPVRRQPGARAGADAPDGPQREQGIQDQLGAREDERTHLEQGRLDGQHQRQRQQQDTRRPAQRLRRASRRIVRDRLRGLRAAGSGARAAHAAIVCGTLRGLRASCDGARAAAHAVLASSGHAADYA